MTALRIGTVSRKIDETKATVIFHPKPPWGIADFNLLYMRRSLILKPHHDSNFFPKP
jgi:hypothetical protein